MKKSVIALMLSIVMAVGSVGGSSVFAAETMPVQENIEIEQKSEKDEASNEEDVVENTEQGISEAENSTEIATAIDDEETETAEEVIIEKSDTEDVADESVSMNDEEHVQTEDEKNGSESSENDQSEHEQDESESAQVEKTEISQSNTVTDAESSEATEALPLTEGQIRAFQEKIAIWKNGSSLSVVYNSSDDAHIKCFLYPGNIDDPAEWTELTKVEENQFYSCTFDVSDSTDDPVRIVLFDGENRFEQIVSTAFSNATTIDVDMQSEETLLVTWSLIEEAEGYLVKMTGADNTVSIYETSESRIELDVVGNSFQDIAMAPFNYDGDVKQFGEAALFRMSSAEIVESEQEIDAAIETDVANDTANDPKAAASSGTCGENLIWSLDDEGTLMISGTGEMIDYTNGTAPWNGSKNQIKAVVVEEGVTSIGAYAFYGCESIVDITLPQSLLVIGDDAFCNAAGPAVIQFPGSLISIGSSAFSSADGIEEVSIPDSVTSIGDNAFTLCPNLKSVTMGNGVTVIPWCAFSLDYYLQEITLPENLQIIETAAFEYCYSLKQIDLPESLIKIGNYAFTNCISLTQIAIPDAVTEIGYNEFNNCTSLMHVTLSKNLIVIPEGAFKHCTSLLSVSIPDSVTDIGSQAFYCNSSMTEAVLPSHLVSIGDEAFCGCISLRKVIMPEAEYEFGESIFVGCPDSIQFLDRHSQDGADLPVIENVPSISSNIGGQNYSTYGDPANSYLIEEGSRRLRVEYYDNCLTREYYTLDGSLISRSVIPLELPIFGGFYEGEDSYFVVLGQNNVEEDDQKEVIRIIRYSKDWVRQGAASISGENTTKPFEVGNVSVSEKDGILYLRTCHEMYKTDDGKNHQANLTAVIRESDMTVTWIFSQVANQSYGYVSHSFHQIIKTDGTDLIAADHGDAWPRAIVLFRYSRKAGSETLSRPQYVNVLPIAGKMGENNTGASLGALEISSSHYLIAGNSVVQDSDSYDPFGTRNIFVTSTSKENFTSSGTTIHWITSYTGNKYPSTPVMTAIPDGRYLLMWTLNGTLNYCFLASDGTPEETIYTSAGSLSDCQPYVKENTVWWYVTNGTGPIYYYISLSAPETVHVQNTGHTLVLDPMGGSLETTEIEVEHGTTYGELPEPQHEDGYEFLGWYTGKYHGIKVTSDMKVRVREQETLYAHWTHHWSFSEDTGTLTIYNTGIIEKYSTVWESFKDQVRNVVISDGVKSIRSYKFNGFSALERVVLPDSLTSIGDYTFQNCVNLTDIVIPSGVTSIGIHAFDGCTSLTDITLPDDLTVISDRIFYNCSSLKSVALPEKVKTIDSCAFCNCTSLTGITLPKTLTSIGFGAFYNCTGLTDVTIRGGTIGDGAFQNCSSITTVSIQEGVTRIGSNAFADCSSITDVTVPLSVTSIGSSAFSNCLKMESSITFSESVTSIGSNTFYNCRSLTDVTFLGGVSVIGDYAFYHCNNLKSVSMQEGSAAIGDYAFCYCNNLEDLIIPGGVTDVGSNTFTHCSSLTEVTLREGVTSIGEYAFYNCQKIEELSLPEGVTSIGTFAFSHCSGLNSITIPDSVSSIESYAFSDCSSLTSVTIPEGVTTVSSRMLCGCSSLTSVTIPNSVTSIESYAFWDCSSLESLVIPKSVTTIESDAFRGCSKLKEIDIPAGVKSIASYTFCGCSSLQSISIPDGVTNIGDFAFYSCSNLESILIPDSVTSIGTYAFEECSSLKSILIPDSVTSIGNGAFERYSGLIISVYSGSYAEEYVQSNNYNYRIVCKTHSWNKKYTIDKEATCTENGSESKHCSVCDIIDERTIRIIPAKGHVWNNDYTVDKKPTNTEEGSKSIHCTVCDSVKEGSVVTIPKLENTLGKTTRGDLFNLANNIKVTWEAVPGAEYYKVYRNGVSEPVIVTKDLVGWDNCTTPALEPGKMYTYKIVASLTGAGDPSGDSTLSYSKSIYRLKTTAFKYVKNTAPGKVTVSYKKSDYGDSYVILYADNADMKNAKSKVIYGADTTAVVLGGFKKGKTYWFQIRVRKSIDGYKLPFYTTFGAKKSVKIMLLIP